MADAAVEFLLENLKQLLLYNAKLILDIKDQVEFLYNDLTLFKAFLRDSTEKRSKHEYLKELVKQIRNVVYEAEDAIDSFVAHAAVHKARKPIQKALHMFDYPAKLRNVARMIEVIRTKVKDIYENKRFGFEGVNVGDGSNGTTKEKKVDSILKLQLFQSQDTIDIVVCDQISSREYFLRSVFDQVDVCSS